MKARSRLILTLVVAALAASKSYALSPWTSQPITAAPLQATSMSCALVAVSSYTALGSSSPIVAANAVREELYIMNVSSVNTTSLAVPAQIVLMGATPSTTTVYGSQAGVWLSPHNPASTTFTDNNASFTMSGGAIYQGAIYAVAQGTGAYVSECEFNP